MCIFQGTIILRPLEASHLLSSLIPEMQGNYLQTSTLLLRFNNSSTVSPHSDALYALQGYKMDGRELTMVFAKDKRKTPEEMREIDPPRRERSRSGDHDDERKPSGHR